MNVSKKGTIKVTKSNYINTLSKFIVPQEEYVKKASFFAPSRRVRKIQMFNSSATSAAIQGSIKSSDGEKIKYYEKKVENISFEKACERELGELQSKLKWVESEAEALVGQLSARSNENSAVSLDIYFEKNRTTFLSPVTDRTGFTKRRDRKDSNKSVKRALLKKESGKSGFTPGVKKIIDLNRVKQALEVQIESRRDELRRKETEIKAIKTKIKGIKAKLYQHYHELLKEGRDTRSEGIVWIIKAIWRLKKNLVPSCLPTFIDEELIQFILSYAHDSLKIESMKIDIDNLQRRSKEMALQDNYMRKMRSTKIRQDTMPSGAFKTSVRDIVAGGSPKTTPRDKVAG